jgi:DHA3 family multidrug efflux protein-like MFS transporter
MSTTKTRALDLSRSTARAFPHLLVNTLRVSVINFTVWFAVTFWVFLETKSVLATGMVAGIFLRRRPSAGSGSAASSITTAKKTIMQAYRWPRWCSMPSPLPPAEPAEQTIP